MSKEKTSFFCQNCGVHFNKWQGQCTSCKLWNTIVEEIARPPENSWDKAPHHLKKNNTPIKIQDIPTNQEQRFKSNNVEFDRVLGGGIVPGAVTLLGGEPGVGKSTLMLQIALQYPYKTLYVSGEESQNQIKMRADRVSKNTNQCYVFSETLLENIFNQIITLLPKLIIIDSIQTLYSESVGASPGSISQIRECASSLIKFAKQTSTPVILIGHITKDGHIAGPKVLEHMVDTVLNFEGDRNHVYRILRSIKNRFGSTSELGIFEMLSYGLKIVDNPSEVLISKNDSTLSGITISATIEGARVLMIESQALVSTAIYGTPQRSTTGFNAKRLNMLLAILEKKAGVKLSVKDVFLNITGGIYVDDPAIDLAVIMAILSSNKNIVIKKIVCFAAEVGLTGEIRPVNRPIQRISEAEKLGFKYIFISKHTKLENLKSRIIIEKVSKLEEVINYFLAN